MSVDLSELADSLRREVDPLTGPSPIADMANSTLVGYLSDAFWEATVDGVISGYTESDGIVTAETGDANLGREYQQLIVFYAGFRIVRNQLRDLKTLFRAKAGEVEFETQQSAQVLKSIMDEMTRKREIILERLADTNRVSPYVIDGIRARSESMALGGVDWVGY